MVFGSIVNAGSQVIQPVANVGGQVVDKAGQAIGRGERAADNVARFGERASDIPNQALDTVGGIGDAFGAIGDYLPWIIGAGLVIGAGGLYVQLTRK